MLARSLSPPTEFADRQPAFTSLRIQQVRSPVLEEDPWVSELTDAPRSLVWRRHLKGEARAFVVSLRRQHVPRRRSTPRLPIIGEASLGHQNRFWSIPDARVIDAETITLHIDGCMAKK